MSAKLYDAIEVDVVERAGCTWCGALCGESCRTTRAPSDLPGGPGTTHAQRWRDLWNATHEPDDHLRVTKRGDR